MVAKFMIPTLKKQLIMYPVVIVVFTLTGILFYNLEWLDSTDVGIFNTLCGFMFYFAPASLSRKDNRFVIAQMPAKTSEKFAFLLIYYWIVVGILTMGLCQFINTFVAKMTMLDADTTKMLTELTGVMGRKLDYVMIVGSFTAIAIQVFALYGVVRAKSNRMITSMVYSVGAYVGMCMLSGFIGAFVGIFSVWHSTYEHIGGDEFSEEQVAAFVADVLPLIVTIVSLILCIVASVLLCKTYKIIKHRGF